MFTATRSARLALVPVLALLATGSAPPRAPAIDLLGISSGTVGRAVPSGWRTRAVRGQAAPLSAVVDSGGEQFLRVSGQDRAGWLVRAVEPRLETGSGKMAWSWRALQAPARADLREADTDDAALRVFVAFGPLRAFGRAPRTIFYSFGGPEPDGYARAGFGSRDIHVIRVASAAGSTDWRDVVVDPGADYARVWGGPAPAIAVVGLLQDTDQTQQNAVADLRSLHWISHDAREQQP